MIKTTNGEIIVNKVEIADTYLSRMKGLMFKPNPPDDYAMVFIFEEEKEIDLHMLFVPFNLVALFLDEDNYVRKIKRLKAWRGRAKGKARKIIEIPEKNYKEIKIGEKLLINP
ncbi:DUF192 domain-containing protein [Methanonatronarchaeum sp. AMET-Sl]|uniref:DUF192 domain-containing protein n=1 Tax=Methanonatronarchaeum sp. AMET-Sl TaxID=3037654 RepID=UPI00244E4AFE|nr:DUF192 domain-containing protein [Methanonatronarchaeum sp. AMET-Sl]WGI17558.1 DUF192 domain-containing protein [Methanonatronarchaeum sp. AMET-Sl]